MAGTTQPGDIWLPPAVASGGRGGVGLLLQAKYGDFFDQQNMFGGKSHGNIYITKTGFSQTTESSLHKEHSYMYIYFVGSFLFKFFFKVKLQLYVFTLVIVCTEKHLSAKQLRIKKIKLFNVKTYYIDNNMRFNPSVMIFQITFMKGNKKKSQRIRCQEYVCSSDIQCVYVWPPPSLLLKQLVQIPPAMMSCLLYRYSCVRRGLAWVGLPI